MATTTPTKLWPELEQLGEDQVRQKLAQGCYRSENIPLVQEWLNRKESIRLGSEKSEDRNIARSAKNASWAAVLIALAALIISIFAIARTAQPVAPAEPATQRPAG